MIQSWEHVIRGFDNLNVVISTFNTKNVLVTRKCLKMRNFKSYWMKTQHKPKTIGRKVECEGVATCKRQQATGKIQKMGKWVPHKLNDRQLENRKIVCLKVWKEVISASNNNGWWTIDLFRKSQAKKTFDWKELETKFKSGKTMMTLISQL